MGGHGEGFALFMGHSGAGQAGARRSQGGGEAGSLGDGETASTQCIALERVENHEPSIKNKTMSKGL